VDSLLDVLLLESNLLLPSVILEELGIMPKSTLRKEIFSIKKLINLTKRDQNLIRMP
jgi:hypothetical protein